MDEKVLELLTPHFIIIPPMAGREVEFRRTRCTAI
jgi:hypothetical protein